MTDDVHNMNTNEDDVVAKIIIHIPTEPEVSFECPLMFKMPKVGQILDIDYENLISEAAQWERAKTILVKNLMVIDRIDGQHVYLRVVDSTD
ncbi:hypothetical protein [Algoriphagus chordae]|uniref:Uncharacterized protein n=1 Tax=Algoriphagus chordae TaxID=237019 RepID=A0A2W7QSS1_9BACT|nr:hypothetical protein [Algoriphagus chordae]PZX51041.1 hypothetical protein LV85_02584 [Algoriphagus chordae]